MGAGEIGHMNEIAHASSIRCIEILAEDRDRWSDSKSRANCKRNNMRLRVVYFANASKRVCSRGVEIAQSSESKAVRNRIGRKHVLEE